MVPFKQTKINGLLIREFKSNVKNNDLVWHRDKLDRVVRVLEGKGWLLQMDNQVPEILLEGQDYFIPSHKYHRLIKGPGTLVLAIKENKMKLSRSQLKRIIKEAASLFESALRESADMHRCMNGKMVSAESNKCLEDIMLRIEDAEHHRTSHSCGTENRVYYNGLLKGLRKKRNRLQKTLHV